MASDWRSEALDAYSNGRRELDRLKDDPRPNVQIYLEDLAEVLLDLKQATIAADRARMDNSMAELMLLLSDLRGLDEGAP